MFSLHLMIDDILGYMPSKSNTIFNVDNDAMGIVLENKNVKILTVSGHLYLLLELQIIISNKTKNVILNMYTCLPYRRYSVYNRNIDRFVLCFLAF